MKKSGWAFCVHHNILLEYCTDYGGRVWAIIATKNKSEHETRFKNFVMVPREKLEGLSGLEELDKAWEAFLRRVAAHDKTWEDPNKALKAYCKAWEAYNKALEVNDKVLEAFTKKHYSELIELLNELAPENTWNGKNIGWE